MSKNLTIKILEVSGLVTVAQYVGLPVGNIRPRNAVTTTGSGVLTRGSLGRLNRLIAQGDEHAKIVRQVVTHMEITGPRYWWQQFATYHAGVEMYSGSTMYQLTSRAVTTEDFSDTTPSQAIKAFEQQIDRSGDLVRAKAALPEGYLQTRLVMCSYQTLRRIWLQRRSHKLPEWREFIESMHELPYCHDLIFVEPYNPWRKLWEQWFNRDIPSPWYHDLEQNVEFCVGCGSNREYGHSNDCVIARAEAMLAQSKESEQ